MQSSDLQQAVKRAIDEAAIACDPLHNGVMDRTDLQRTISRLKQTLEEVSRVSENLRDQHDDFIARLSRSHIEADWGPAADHKPA